MKIQIRTNSLGRMKALFTQDVFTEQVVAAHAVRVRVTPALSADAPGKEEKGTRAGSRTEGSWPLLALLELLRRKV